MTANTLGIDLLIWGHVFFVSKWFIWDSRRAQGDLEAGGRGRGDVSVVVSGPGTAALAVVPLVVALLSFALEQPVL